MILMLKMADFEKRPSLYELATRSSAIAILGAGGLRYDGASRAGAGTLPPGPTAGHARRANRASTRFTSVEQASEEGVEEGVKWALSQLAAPRPPPSLPFASHAQEADRASTRYTSVEAT